jgi:predicted Rossmann fold flavoprotein
LLHHLVIIGGGAAGFFSAVNAARMNPSLRVTILEKSGKLLSKVKVSGGGRCNVTHACFDITEMSRNYPRGGNFVKKTFHHFFTADTVNWFEERGIKLKRESDGRMFPVSDTSQTIINCLLEEAAKRQVAVRVHTEAAGIKMAKAKFKIETKTGEIIDTDYLLIASGGIVQLDKAAWLKEFGHQIQKPVPSLFTFNLAKEKAASSVTQLMGVTVEKVSIKISGTKLLQQGPLLITHWGFSGPAVLKLSAWGARELSERNWNFDISINWLGDMNEQELRESFAEMRQTTPSQRIKTKNKFQIPNRLWDFLASISGVKEDMRWADLPSGVQNNFIRNLCSYTACIKGKTTFKEEFVTAGGITTSEIDHNTMMSKLVPNLFFAGEVMDVDGVTGGFNFQHAWTSGYIAAKAIAELAKSAS